MHEFVLAALYLMSPIWPLAHCSDCKGSSCRQLVHAVRFYAATAGQTLPLHRTLARTSCYLKPLQFKGWVMFSCLLVQVACGMCCGHKACHPCWESC